MFQGAGQDVVGVGADHQAFDGQAHALGDPSGEDVAEIARRHREGDGAVRGAQDHGAGEVIDRLCGDSRPIDRVDAGEPQLIGEIRVLEQGFDDVLAIVEITVDGDGVDIVRPHRGHLAALHLGDAAIGKQDEDIDLIEPAESLDGGAAGIARGGADDGGARAAGPQDMVHQPAEKLHRHVLERQRRTVEKLKQKQVVVELHQRAHRRVAERGVGFLDHPVEIGIRDLTVDQRPQDELGRIGITLSRQSGDRVTGNLRPALGQVQTAVAGETGEESIGKAEGRRGAAGRNV